MTPIEMAGALFLQGAMCFIQSMTFTWSGRSRNSGDPSYHRYASWASNGTFFLTNSFMTVTVVNAINSGDYVYAALAGLVYLLATAEGSVLMMKILLKTEKGKRRVGASG